MSAYDTYTLADALDSGIGYIPQGKLSVVNLNIGITVTVQVTHTELGDETFTLTAAGSTVEIPLAGISHWRISASSYPATILFDRSTVPHVLSTPQSFAGAGGGGATVNVETVGLAGTLTSTVVTVGVVAVTLPAAQLANRRAVIVQALASNTKTIYLGGAGVTADEALTGGLQLTPGQSVSVELGSANLYAISTAAGQHVAVIEGS